MLKQTASFPSGNPNIDAWFLEKLPYGDFLEVLLLNKASSKYVAKEYIWFNRFISENGQEDFEYVKTIIQRPWKDFYLLAFNLEKGDHNNGLFLAAQGGYRDLVDFFIFKGANAWDLGMHGAALRGHRALVEFFISQGANAWDWGMREAARGGHRDLVEFFISQGANYWNWG